MQQLPSWFGSPETRGRVCTHGFAPCSVLCQASPRPDPPEKRSQHCWGSEQPALPLVSLLLLVFLASVLAVYLQGSAEALGIPELLVSPTPFTSFSVE